MGTIGNWALHWALGHQQYLIGIASGYAAAHLRQVFDYLYDKADSFPAFHSFVTSHSDEIESGIAELADEAKKKIEASKAKDVPHP